MKTNAWLPAAQVPPITRADYAGLEEDPETAKAFERACRLRLFATCLPALVGWLAAMFMTFTRTGFLGGDGVRTFLFVAVSFGLTFVALVFYALRFLGVRPISHRSGRPMELFRRNDLPAGADFEFVYICRESRTYFVRTVKADAD